MPRATVSSDHVRKDLTSCDGGFVTLKRMSYGDWLYRQEIAMKITMTNMEKGSSQGQMDIAQLAVTEFEFSKCIVEHNLEDDSDQPLDFSGVNGIKQLDPKIGEEISSYIDELHKFNLEK